MRHIASKKIAAFAVMFITANVFAIGSSEPDVAPDPATPPTSMTLCSDMVVNNNPRLTPTLAANPLSSTAPTTVSVSGGGAGWGGGPIIGVIGGSFNPGCPADHPYLSSLDEGWGGSFGVAGGAGMTAVCSSAPDTTPMRISTGSDPGGTYNTWQAGPNCN